MTVISVQLELALEATTAGALALGAVAAARQDHPELQATVTVSAKKITAALNSVSDSMPPAPAVDIPKVKLNGHKVAKKIPWAPQEAVAPEQIPPSPWDPDPVTVNPEYRSEPILEASCCRALLLEVMRRAAYDWVLYRMSSKLKDRELAEDAYYWLFEEDEESISWRERSDTDKQLTSFITICEILELDPEWVRRQIRRLTVKNVMSVGRPAESRSSYPDDNSSDEYTLHGLEIDVLDKLG